MSPENLQAIVLELTNVTACFLDQLHPQNMISIKGNLHCHHKLTLNCWKYSLNSNSVLISGKKVFVCEKLEMEITYFRF